MDKVDSEVYNNYWSLGLSYTITDRAESDYFDSL